MDGYAVTIEAESSAPPTDEQISELLDALLQDHGASVSGGGGHSTWSITMSVDAAPGDPVGSGAAALELVRSHAGRLGFPAWEVAALEVLTYAEQDRRLAIPLIPELVGTAELAEILGVSKQRVSELRGRDGWPEPVAELASGPVYTLMSIRHFAESWVRKPGRPRKVAG